MPRSIAAAISGFALVAALAASACASQTAATPTPAQPTNIPAAVQPPIATPTNLPDESAELANALWTWTGIFTDGQRVTAVTDPLQYTIEFLPGGMVDIVADCNLASGNYQLTTSGGMFIEVTSVTRMACSAGSQAVEFLERISAFGGDYTVDQYGLSLLLSENEEMRFSPVIALDVPQPAEDAPTAIARGNIPIRSGPGEDYPPYGYMRAGQRAEIAGMYASWWAINLPGYPGGTGWVSQQDVKADGADNVSSITPPPTATKSVLFPTPTPE